MYASSGRRVCTAGFAVCLEFALTCAVLPARAADCGVSEYRPSAQARETALQEAGQMAASGRWADARAVYLWVLARHKDDAEALFGLARMDAWGGCWAMSEAEYGRVLMAHPGDADVRAGYVDLLVWRGRLDDAERALDRGLAVDPGAPLLLARAARFAYWRGDATTAVKLADAAERGAPDDGDVRAMRDRMFLGEARLTGRVDRYPDGYQNLYSVSSQALARRGRVEVYGGAQLLERYGGPPGTPTVLDGRYPLGIAYHPAMGAMVGGEIAPGAPSNAIPVFSAKAWALVPLVGPFDAFFAYSVWDFSGGEIVNILNPAVGLALPHELRLDLRGWVTTVSLPATAGSQGKGEVVGAVGIQLGWSATSRLDAGFTYTYGAELDQSPTLYQLVEYRSHAAVGFVDWLLGRRGGLRPLVGVQYRTPTDIFIWTFEMSAYGRF